MDPDIAEAIPKLAAAGVLDETKAAGLRRIALGKRVSVHDELRLLLYAGVLLVASGVGLLVRQNLERIGPTVVAVVLAIAAASCLVWVGAKASPFSRGESTTPHFAFDYLLLLGALLVAADLAYVELRFTPLGASWPWHLLLVAILYAGLGVRYDSKTLFSLSLATFAAWRGFSLAMFGRRLGREVDERIAVEAVVWGLAFVLLGVLLKRSRFKPHFEPVATHLGWLFAFLGPVYRLDSDLATAWAALLIGAGAGLAVFSYRGRRFWLFAMGVVAAHIGLSRWVVEAISPGGDTLFLVWLVLSGIAVVVGLGFVHRRLGAER